ncbi:alpha/beta fold hydrolase [Pseudoxanthomonas indica]|uniref:Pimeloyl-ACP methyl ester carboxylesterase n=1 Tax=Pseudoxanthomonas indica TaxID=428993 RepID=A0A1T5JP98_9GAMM|nr:alpha/beta fold hydrolase [Pseudoxanthomonas indica]GGD43481.1 alpha/beta hydrolase [Pseudoxanthomonas indica]SKC53221.1 Pimeloyl-ACP methyl ester carboxylesterase [Pseudoxanthomonas indica]
MVTLSASSSSTAASDSLRLAGEGGVQLAASRYRAPASLQSHSALVYAHGFGQTRHAWARTGASLAKAGYGGLSYDARGHGDSQRNDPARPYAGEQFADDLIIVAGDQAQAPVLIGASMGGLFGLIAEARWPGLFQAMVLVDITPRWEAAGLQRILGFMTAFPHGFESLEHASDTIAAYLPHRRSRKSPEELRELLRCGEDGRWRWHWDPRLIDELARDSARHQDDIAEAARRVRCPLLLISGGRSDLVSAETVEEFRTLAPHARHVHLPQATHMVAGDDNDTFTATVLEYLAELRSDSIATSPDPIETSALGGTATGASP